MALQRSFGTTAPISEAEYRSTPKTAMSRRQRAINKAQQFAWNLKNASFAGTRKGKSSQPGKTIGRVDRDGNIKLAPTSPSTASPADTPSPAAGASSSEAGSEVTPAEQLATILANPPTKFPLWDKKYHAAYKRVFQRVNAAFLATQLRRIGKLPIKMHKAIVIQTILRDNGWPAPQEQAAEAPPEPVEMTTQSTFSYPLFYLSSGDSAKVSPRPARISAVPFLEGHGDSAGTHAEPRYHLFSDPSCQRG